MITSEIIIPTNFELEYKPRNVLRKAGNAGAKAVRARLTEGQGAGGPLPQPSDIDRKTDALADAFFSQDKKAKRAAKAIGPLRRTDTLLKSVQFREKKNAKGRRDGTAGGTIYPTGERARGKVTSAKTQKRNAGIMAVLMATHPDILAANPMGVDKDVDQAIRERAVAAMKEEQFKLRNKGVRKIVNKVTGRTAARAGKA